MKAQRRHELKTNTLDAKLKKAPAFFQQHSSSILLGLTLCVLAFVLVRYYMDRKAEKAQRVGESMGEALFTMGDMATMAERGNLHGYSTLLNKVDDDVSNVLDNSEDPKIRATALIIRGDANWKAANVPPVPGATTRPELKLEKTNEQYLKVAEGAYDKVLEPPLDVDAVSVTRARLGLAAIAENREQFDKARDYYQKIIADPAIDKTYVALAKRRMDELPALETPIYLSKSAPVDAVIPASANPSTRPSTGVSVPPSTQPAATQPVVAPH